MRQMMTKLHGYVTAFYQQWFLDMACHVSSYWDAVTCLRVGRKVEIGMVGTADRD